MILEKIAQTVAQETSNIIGYPVSISDDKGYLIGTNDPSRVGIFDKLFFEVVKQKKMIQWEAIHVKNLLNIFPGSSAPIIVNNKAIGAIGIIGKADETEKYIQLVKNHIEMLCYQHLKSEIADLETKALDTLMQYIFHFDSKNDNIERITDYGKMIGYNLEIERACIIIDIAALSTNILNTTTNKISLHQLHQELLESIKFHFVEHNEDLIGQANLEQFSIFLATGSKGMDKSFINRIDYKINKVNQFLEKKYGLSAVVAIGNTAKGTQGMKESYDNAIRTLQAGKKTEIHPKIYYYNSWNITLEILTTELPPTLLTQLNKNVDPFINHYNFETLASTFMVYCKSNMNLSETARNLFIHRNSLIYRLEKIKELTSLNISNFEHCILLYIAIKNKIQENQNLQSVSSNAK
ncbi:sugar diacid recognition domain-containing protein [Niallia sp. 03190]|uniref:sugar diacid recognition domain-containing protein n=1 Tax=Niallia sp. 03190 TaxID=3458061 RepID=UPI004044962F